MPGYFPNKHPSPRLTRPSARKAARSIRVWSDDSRMSVDGSPDSLFCMHRGKYKNSWMPGKRRLRASSKRERYLIKQPLARVSVSACRRVAVIKRWLLVLTKQRLVPPPCESTPVFGAAVLERLRIAKQVI